MIHRVLIIEDDTVLRHSITQLLELDGLDPVPTANFTQARRSIRSNFRGVILSDIRMPDHNGFDVLKFTQIRDPDLPVILLTGHSDVPTAKQALMQGAYDYLEKPCDPAQLIRAIRNALQERTTILKKRADPAVLLKRTSSTQPVGTLAHQLECHERQIIEDTLAATGGNVNQAAIHLGIPRNTLYDHMARLRITARSFRKS